MPKVIFDGVPNGYGFRVLYVSVKGVGQLRVGFPDGDVQVMAEQMTDLKQNDAAEAEWRLIFTDGINNDGMALTLFEEEDEELLKGVTAITEAGGLGAPFVLDYDDGTIKGRWPLS